MHGETRGPNQPELTQLELDIQELLWASRPERQIDADTARALHAEVTYCASRAQAADLPYSASLLRQAAAQLRLRIENRS